MLADSRSRSLVSNFAEQWLHLRNLESVDARSAALSRLRRQPAAGLPPGNRTVLRECSARRSQRARPAEGGLHLSERTARQALRNSPRLRQPLPPRRAGQGQQARRVAAPGKHSDGDVLCHAHFAGDSRQVDSGEYSRDAAAATAAERAGAERQHGVGNSFRARATGRASRQCRLRELSQSDGSGRLLRWRISTRSAAGEPSKKASRSTPPAAFPTAASSTALSGLEQGLLNRPELFVGTLTEKLLTFALGRGVEHYDAPAVRKIVRDAKSSRFRFSSVILGVVNSTPFKMRRSL